jgi:O-antigen/teichoic acid export membrane protein
LRDQSPLIIAGLVLSLADIGYFSLAIRVGRCLGQLFEEITSRPLLSLMSREQNSPGRFGAVLTEVLTVVGLVAPPAYVGLAMVGSVAIPLMFGPAWASAGHLLPMLCVVLGGWLLLHIVAVSLRARALGRIALQLCAPAALVDFVLVSAIMPIGLQWALIALAARAILSLPPVMWVLQRHLDVDLKRLAKLWTAPLAASATMGGVILLLRPLVDPGLGGVALIITAAAGVYVAALAAFAILSVGKAAFRQEVSFLLGGLR